MPTLYFELAASPGTVSRSLALPTRDAVKGSAVQGDEASKGDLKRHREIWGARSAAPKPCAKPWGSQASSRLRDPKRTGHLCVLWHRYSD